jgi:hypothetical protein
MDTTGDTTDHTDVHALTYVSSATTLLSVPELVELLEQSRPKNDEQGVTGMLLYSGGNIIQALEGPMAAVESIFDAIEVDPRHTDVRVLDRGATPERSFPNWSMGFRNVSEREVADIDGYADFVRRPVGQDLGDSAGSAYELLERFRGSTSR